MTVFVEVSIPSDAFTLGDVLGTPGVQVELLACVPVSQEPVSHIWITGGYDVSAFERRVRSDARVAALTALDGAAQRTLYAIEWADDIDGVLGAFREHGLITEQATGTDETWTFQLRAPDQATLDAFHHEPRITELPLTLQRVAHSPDGTEDDADGLTAKQHEAVLLAFNQGYFAVPRETTLTELAEEIDISRQAFTRRLHRGLHSILMQRLDTSELPE